MDFQDLEAWEVPGQENHKIYTFKGLPNSMFIKKYHQGVKLKILDFYVAPGSWNLFLSESFSDNNNHLSTTSTKLGPWKDLFVGKIWWKFQLNIVSKTDDIELLDLPDFLIQPC